MIKLAKSSSGCIRTENSPNKKESILSIFQNQAQNEKKSGRVAKPTIDML
jgi:hypothetical protein